MIVHIIYISVILLLIGVIVYLIRRADAFIVSIENVQADNDALRIVLSNIRDLSIETETTLREIDVKGAFEAEDDVGVAFKNIREVSSTLSEFISKNFESVQLNGVNYIK